MARIFFAGASQVEITPPLGTILNGNFVAYYAQEVHDPLYSKALVLDDGRSVLVLVMVDICAMDKEFILDIKKDIHRQFAIPPGNILIAATHTHSAGSVIDLLGTPCDLGYRKSIGSKILESVVLALRKMQPAKLGFAAVDVPEHAVCRRYYMKSGYSAYNPVTGGNDIVKTNPAGDEQMIERRASAADTELCCLAIMSMEGKWISLLANYSMHYVGDCPDGIVTADYFGAFSRCITQKLGAGEDFVAMLSNGTSGDTNIWDFLDPERYPNKHYEKSELIGADLATKLAEKLKTIPWNNNPVLSSAYADITVAVRKPSSKEINAAKKILAETNYRLLTPDREGIISIYAREQILLNEFPDTTEFPVQALKIGDIIIGGLAGEFFAESGLCLKKQLIMEKYFTITMANGYSGYIPPAHEIKKGGYETWRCRNSHLEMHAEELIRNKLLTLIRQG